MVADVLSRRDARIRWLQMEVVVHLDIEGVMIDPATVISISIVDGDLVGRGGMELVREVRGRGVVLDVLHDLRVEGDVGVGGEREGEGLHVGDGGAEGGCERLLLMVLLLSLWMLGHLHLLGLRLGKARAGTGRSVCLERRVVLLEIDDVLDLGDDATRRAASFVGRGGVGTRRGGFVDFLAVRAVLDDETDGFFDAHPMELLGDGGGRFVDPAMLLHMHEPGNLILPLRIGHHLLILEHQPLPALSRLLATRSRQ